MSTLGTQILTHYHHTLLASEKAQAYLRERGLDDQAAIDHFRLGFCDGSFSPTLPDRQLSAGRKQRGELESLGFLDERGHEKFRPCIIFPMHDEHGHLVQVYGRKISQRLKSKRYHETLNPRRDVLWNLDECRHHREIILCKGLTDALTYWIKGFRHVCGLLGADHFHADHAAILASFGVKRVLLSFDNDQAGHDATRQASHLLKQHGIVSLRLILPRGMDANRYALKHNLRDLIERAEPLRLPESAELGSLASHTPAETLITAQPEPEPPPTPMATMDEPAAPEESPSPPIDEEPALKVTAKKEPITIKGEDIFADFDGRLYRVRGLSRNLSVDSMKVNLRLSRGDLLFVDTVELYSYRQRASFVAQAVNELGFGEDQVKRDLGRLILALETVQDSKLAQVLQAYELSQAERKAALTFLRDPQLLKRIADDLNHSGLVGEEPNKLVGYLAMVSRKLPKPLAILVQSTSAAGKSSLLDMLLSFVPPEDCLKYSSITPQSLYYMAEKGIKHRILALAEGEGAAKASYSLKLLQSEGELVISSTSGDRKGLTAKEYRVEGPVMIAMTTTAVDIDNELLNRCIVLTVDETRQQTRAIHQIQRHHQTLEGLIARKTFEATLDLHRNAQRLLRPVAVINPYAPYLTFLDEKTRLRRDHVKYLSLIQAVTFLHQYQRPLHSKQVGGQTLEYIETTIEDIKLANQLAHHVLGVTLDDLPPHTRRLLQLIHRMVGERCREQAIPRREFRFTRREVREYSQLGDTQLKTHLKRLVEYEYLAMTVHKRTHHYECLYNGEGQDQQPFLMGLADMAKLERAASSAQRSGSLVDRSGHRRPTVGPESASGLSPQTAPIAYESTASSHHRSHTI